MNDLERVAKRLFWWKSPSEALEYPVRFLAEVMTYGTIEDLAVVERHFPESAFRDVLDNPQPVYSIHALGITGTSALVSHRRQSYRSDRFPTISSKTTRGSSAESKSLGDSFKKIGEFA